MLCRLSRSLKVRWLRVDTEEKPEKDLNSTPHNLRRSPTDGASDQVNPRVPRPKTSAFCRLSKTR